MVDKLMHEPHIRILQITDSHLFASVDNSLLGINTEDSLLSVLTLVKEESKYDAIFMTGDLAQDGSRAAYDRLLQHMSDFTCPVLYTPGNHDHKAQLNDALQAVDHPYNNQISLGNWKIMLLDSAIEGSAAGQISEQGLQELQDCIEHTTEDNILLFLHHHSVDINCQWLKTLGVKNADTFIDIISKSSKVRAVFCGHIHQDFHALINNIHFYSTPSTCIQFKPESNYFTLDPLYPGYRGIDLYTDGSIKTSVVRLKDFDLQLDTDTQRY